MDLQIFASDLNNFTGNYGAITDKLHKDQTASYIDLNNEALDVGEDALGNELPMLSNPAYAAGKRSKGGKSKGKWDLKDTGDFRRAMSMDKEGFIFSRDNKAGKLVPLLEGFGLDIFGVQEKKLDAHIKEQIIPEFYDIIRTKLKIT